MEGINNPYKSNPILKYSIFTDHMICSFEGICFVKNEHFEFEKKIEKLYAIMTKVLDKLKYIDSDNKEKIIGAISIKQNLLKKLLKKYKDIKEKFIEYDDFYRNKLIKFYKNEYDDIIFDIFKKKKYLSIGIDIQILLRDKFGDFLSDYSGLIDEFININNYIIKIKILFNIE